MLSYTYIYKGSITMCTTIRMGRPIKIQVFLDLQTYQDVVEFEAEHRLRTDSEAVFRILQDHFTKVHLTRKQFRQIQEKLAEKEEEATKE